MEWIVVKDRMPEESIKKVLLFSPVYEENHPMRIRIVNAQFLPFCVEATHWIPLPEPPK